MSLFLFALLLFLSPVTSLPADLSASSLAVKGFVSLVLLATGAWLLVQPNGVHHASTSATGRVGAKSRHRSSTIVVVPLPSRLTPGTEIGRLATVIQGGRTRLDTIVTCQRTASRHLDSAEVALNALVAEIVSVMPTTVTQSPRLRATLAMAA